MSQRYSRIIAQLCKLRNITNVSEINLIKRAIDQNNDSLVLDEEIMTRKKWQEFKSQFEKKKFERTLAFRYPQKALPVANSQSKSIKCIIFGPCGNGKTTTINHLCGSQLPSGSSSSSLTRDVTQIQSLQKYPVPLIFYDTPGTTAHQEKLLHATLVRQLLEFAPLNCIMILVKYDNRTDEFVMDISRQVNMLPKYQSNILFLVSHFDQISKTPQQEIAEIESAMKRLLPKFTNQMIFFSNNTVDPKQLSDSIYNIARSYNKVKINIDEKTFFEFFNIQKSEVQDLFFKHSEKEITQQMKDLTDDYIAYAVSLPQNNDRDAIFQDIEFTLKNQLLELLDNYVEKYKNAMLSYEYYESFYTLQLRKNDNLNRYQEKIRSLQKFSYFQSQATGAKLDIRDLIKKCPNPNCNSPQGPLIWFRIEACPNTTCGSRPSCIYDYIKKPVLRFKIIRDRKTKKVDIQQKTEQEIEEQIQKNKKKGNTLQQQNTKLMTKEQKIKSLNQNTVYISEVQKKKAKGCGQAMNFQTLPRLPNIEKLLIEWYGTHTIQQVIQLFQADQDLERTRKEMQKKARQSFSIFKWWDKD